MSPTNGYASNNDVSHSVSETSESPSASPWRRAADSPSKPLLLEIGRLSLNYDRELHSRLDEETFEREKEHRLALAAAVEEHEHVRRTAERAKERVQLQLDAAKRRHEEEENRALERERQRVVEEEIAERRRQIEEIKRTEERRKAVEEAKALAEAEEKRRVEKEQEYAREAKRLAQKRHADREEREAREKREAEEAAKHQAAKAVTPAKPTTAPSAPVPAATSTLLGTKSTSEGDANFKQYIALHQRLKGMRTFMVEERKKDPELKKRMSEGRRMLKQCVGQLTQGAGSNKVPISRIRAVLNDGLNYRRLTLDIRPYIIRPLPNINESDAHVPALLVYLFNIFSKAIIHQFIDEAGVTPAAADPTGIVAISMFAAPEFRWQGISLIDMLIAKFHIVCPVLWGTYGDENTEGGRRRLGWWREEPGGSWVSEQRHGERMTGLGAGFAALSLRDFKNSKNTNPYPHKHYWYSLACIVNTPPEKRSSTHCLVLKAMIELYVPRILAFYGQAGVVALRKALVDFPQQMPEQSVAARALATVPEILKKSLNLAL